MKKTNVDKLITDMLAGDCYSLARLITLAENEDENIPAIREALAPRLHRAYRIGITGLAGSGKSTLIDKLTAIVRSKGLSVGVVAIDPSSAFTGGAVLGDRIRMQQHYLDDKVFIRSLATRGNCGGLCEAASDTVDIMDASGKDVIIIETTGVGQTEVDITGIADVVVVVMVPGFGDGIQLMKSGLQEIADIIVINKADREGAEELAADINDSFMLIKAEVKPSIIMVSGVKNTGFEELYQELDRIRGKPGIRRNLQVKSR